MNSPFNRLDLNLLRVLDAVMEEHSVLKASQRLHLSQSAVSHSLARLRELVNDELLVRTAGGMRPTARAVAMFPIIRRALQSMETAVQPPKFDPPVSDKQFTIAANDCMTTLVLPLFLTLLKKEAPHVDIVIKPSTRIDLAEQIDLDRIDLVVGTFSEAPQRFRSYTLFQYDDVLISDSQLQLGTVTLDKLASLPLAVVSLGGEKDGAVDGFISERGLARRSEMYDRISLEHALLQTELVPRIAVTLPHFLALPELLHGSSLAAIVPRPLAIAFHRQYSLAVYELPYPTSSLEVRSLWHSRNDDDVAHVWLRDLLRRATESLRTSVARFPSNASDGLAQR